MRACGVRDRGSIPRGSTNDTTIPPARDFVRLCWSQRCFCLEETVNLKNRIGKKPDRTRQLAHLNVARIAAAEAVRRAKSSRIAQANLTAINLARELPINKEEIGKSLLAMLYWAEGGKQDGNMKFTNTDPDLMLFFITLLRKQYPTEEKRFRVALQLHSYHRSKEEVNFWSKILNIPISQFWKIYRKPRGGRRTYRRNSHGICNIHYASSAIQRELLALGRELVLKATMNA